MEAGIEQLLPQIKALLLFYQVEAAYLFGSAARGVMKENSDVDFIIRFPEDMDFVTYSDNYFTLCHELEKLLHKKVDLVTEKTLQNPFLISSINKDKIRLI